MNRESVLDLTFATTPLANLIEDWQTLGGIGSDHLGILFTIRTPRTQQLNKPAPRFNTKKANWNLFSKVLAKEIANSSALSNASTLNYSTSRSLALLQGEDQDLEEQLETLGKELTISITKAAKAAIPQCSTTAKSKPWWNQDLKALRTSMLSKQRQLQRELAFSLTSAYTWKREYLIARNTRYSAVKIAKRDHWNQFLEREDPKSIFKAMAYTRTTYSQNIPAIQGLRGIEESFQGKCSALRETLFPSPPASRPIEWDNYQPS
ncbi:uncharacterized protein M421DRAFT_32391, partial [Didymella exigua CBS 183.55]